MNIFFILIIATLTSIDFSATAFKDDHNTVTGIFMEDRISLCKETIKSVTIAHFSVLFSDPHTLYDTYNTQNSFLLNDVDDDKPLSILKRVLQDNAIRDDLFFVGYLQTKLLLNIKDLTEGAIVWTPRTVIDKRQIIPSDIAYYFKVKSFDDLIDMVDTSHEYHAQRLFREWYNFYHELQQASPLHNFAFTTSSQADPPVMRHLHFLKTFLQDNMSLDHAYAFSNYMCLFYLFEYLRHLLILLLHYGSYSLGSISVDRQRVINAAQDWKQLKKFWSEYKLMSFQHYSIRLIYEDSLKKRPLWHVDNILFSRPVSGAEPVEKMEVRNVPTTGIGYMHSVMMGNRLIVYTSVPLVNNTLVGRYICKRGVDCVYRQRNIGLSISDFLSGINN